jgi:hypothetical protein
MIFEEWVVRSATSVSPLWKHITQASLLRNTHARTHTKRELTGPKVEGAFTLAVATEFHLPVLSFG